MSDEDKNRPVSTVQGEGEQVRAESLTSAI